MKRDFGKDTTATQGFTRRGALGCLAWGGTGLLWTVTAGVPVASILSSGARAATAGSFRFVQISDTHIGFAKPANPDAAGTAKAAVDLINGSASDAALVLHTGDITHLSKPAEFDAAASILKGLKIAEFHTVPGEHDVLDEAQTAFLDRYGAASGGKGYYSFDHGGVHFIALVNVLDFKPGGQGRLGDKQLEWLEDDLKGRSASQPLVIFTHIPLWSLYPQWGWSTEDWPRAMEYVKRFGSVTVLNGHIHQVVQKVEGAVRYYTARSTAYPQPAAGQGDGPGPLAVPAEQLRHVLGVRRIDIVDQAAPLAIADATLG
jgi:3',5'-cyclic AMP phosphodiesterase CpdA